MIFRIYTNAYIEKKAAARARTLLPLVRLHQSHRGRVRTQLGDERGEALRWIQTQHQHLMVDLPRHPILQQRVAEANIEQQALFNLAATAPAANNAPDNNNNIIVNLMITMAAATPPAPAPASPAPEAAMCKSIELEITTMDANLYFYIVLAASSSVGRHCYCMFRGSKLIIIQVSTALYVEGSAIESEERIRVQ